MTERCGKLIVLSGSSGSGKGTVVKSLFKRYDGFCFSVSVTTRKARAGEVDGRDYYFITDEKFAEMVSSGSLLEHAEFVGSNYGTPREMVMQKLAEGKNVILEIDICGAKQVKQSFPEAVLIFITPPTFAELRARLEGRATETPDKVERRLAAARREALEMTFYDHVIINSYGRVDEAADAVAAIAAGNYTDNVDIPAFIKEYLK